MLERLARLNQEYPEKPEVFEWAVYKVITSFTTSRFLKPAQDPDKKARKKRLSDYQIKLFDKIHF